MRGGEVARLKQAATRANGRGAYEQALSVYQELERLEPDSAAWPKRIGEMHRRLGRGHEAVAAWRRAADRFARAGFLLKAIAICHLILRHDPDNTEAQRQLAAFNQQRPGQLGIGDAAATAAVEVGARRGTPLAQLPLERVSKEASGEAPAGDGGRSSITEIAIAGEDDHAAQAAREADMGAARGAGRGVRARERTRATLARTPLFSDLPADSLESLIGKVELVEVAAQQVVFCEGDPGDALYVVAEGKVAVRSAEVTHNLAELGEGSFFGEIALVTDEPRSATVKAIEPTALLRMGREVVSDLVKQRKEVLNVILSFLRERLIDRLVTTSPLFAPFAGAQRRELAERFHLLHADAGAEIVVQGSRSGGLFVLLCGRAEVDRTDDGTTRRLAVLQRGGIFGEISLLTGEPAIATVRTTTKLLALEMPADAFREVIMTHPQVLAFVGELAEARRAALREALASGGAYTEETLDLV